MAANPVVTAVASSTSAPTSPETSVATLAPGGGGSSATQEVLVRADLPLVGASSVTGVTVKIRRGSGITGTTLATVAYTVSGAVTVAGTIAYLDAAYDGTGYSLTVTAAGAAATCGPGTFTATISPLAQTWGA